MQNRVFEKCIWGATLALCALMLLTDSAHASHDGSLVELASNPVVYMIGLLGAFIGCKLVSPPGGQF